MIAARTAIGASLTALLFSAFYAIGTPVSAPFVDNVYIEELTWVEVRDHLKRGYKTIIVPTGGVEQNGPHMVLGKHNYVVRETAGRLARRLGNTLVAPVVTYVPEGDIGDEDSHMRFPGTFTIPVETFEEILEFAARSAAAHGFQEILFIGDSLDNQPAQQNVADHLRREFEGNTIRIHHISNYYSSDKNGQIALLRDQGFSDQEIGGHAGIRDTSEMMVAFPAGVRLGLRNLHGGHGFKKSGVHGDPRLATMEIGQDMIALKVEAAYRQILAFRLEQPSS